MARRIVSEENPTEKASKQARANANAKFDKATKKKPAKATVPPRKVHDDLGTPEEFRTALNKIEAAEKRFKKKKAEAAEMVAAAKVDLNEIYDVTVARFIGRKASKRSIKRILELKARNGDETRSEMVFENWAMKAAGIEGAEQMEMFAEPVKDPADALKKAEDAGYVIGAEAGNTTDNPHHPGSEAGQAWLRGYHRAQGDNAAKIGKADDKDLFKDVDDQGAGKVASLADARSRKAKAMTVPTVDGSSAPPEPNTRKAAAAARAKAPQKTKAVGKGKKPKVKAEADDVKEAAE